MTDERALSHLQTTTDSLMQHFVSAAAIEAKRAEYAALSADSPAGYESVRLAIANCRTTRVGIEKKRKALKADSLEYGRQVDRVAKELTSLIEDLEGPLKVKKAVVDDEKARVKHEAEEADRQAFEEAVRAEREAEEAKLREEREKLAEERRVVQEAQRVEREKLEAEEARQHEERKKLEAERRAVEAAREKVAREEFEREARVRAATEAKKRVEAERVAAEEARVAEAERKARMAERLEALRPDAEKVEAFAEAIRAVALPVVSDPDVDHLLTTARVELSEIVHELVEEVAALAEDKNGV